MTERAWRVAVSETQTNAGEYDARIYYGETDVRSDYADVTVGYWPTEEEARAAAEAELVRRQAEYPADNSYIY